MSVGAYRIEENNKHNFVKILSSDLETIKGFEKNFINKQKERNEIICYRQSNKTFKIT